MANSSQRNQVFISYSRKDKKWLDRLQIFLTPHIRKGKISIWDDTKIKSGDEWREKIKQAIAQAKVAVLLVSPDFLHSDFIAKHELPPLLEAAQNDGLRVLWIAVRPSGYAETEIERYQAMNDPAIPLASITGAKREKELVRICKEIESAVVEEKEAEPTQTKIAPRPNFKVTVPVTSYPGLLRLDVNVLRMAKPDERGVLYPILAEFENLPSGKGKSAEVLDVWAHITYRDFDFMNAELARVGSGCWIDQPIADVSFPIRTPRYLMLGGWHVDKAEPMVNEFRIFEYSRDLHRAAEKEVKIAGPKTPFVTVNGQLGIAQRRLVVSVVLTSNGHHDDSCEYHFQIAIFGGDGTGHTITCVKKP